MAQASGAPIDAFGHRHLLASATARMATPIRLGEEP
jgi:hypothetical protein